MKGKISLTSIFYTQYTCDDDDDDDMNGILRMKKKSYRKVYFYGRKKWDFTSKWFVINERFKGDDFLSLLTESFL